MISSSDFIHLPYPRDLTEGGIAYALHALPHLYKRLGGSVPNGVRRIVAEAAVELAFRHYLSEHEIPFEVKEAAPFTDPNHYDVLLAGQRCEIKSFFINRRDQVSQIKHSPQILLNVPALVASDQNAAEGYGSNDIYLFAFLAGLVAVTEEDLQKVFQKGQPYYFVHILPESWIRPAKWNPLGTLVLKSDADKSQRLEIGGQDAGGEMVSLEVELPARQRIEIPNEFFSLAYIHRYDKPNARLGIHCPARKETYVIAPSSWSNIWVYGMDILLAGYLRREEFNRRASFIREGARVFQYDKTRTKNLAVDVCDLKSISELLGRVKQSNL